MGLDGKKMVESLSRLSETKNMKQVKSLSYSLFPGYHCPLMGAMLTVREIEHSVMVVVGPDECGYYTKMATSGGGLKTDGCEMLSVVLDQHDVTFGCQEKMDEAFEELMAEYSPEAVYLVTTCVVEVIGDDVESMAAAYTEKYNIPVIVVHAENFKTDDHLPGIEHTLDASFAIMQKQTTEELCVNVLGMRLGDFTKTEAYQVLKEAGVGTYMSLPGKTSVEIIRTAPKAKCNIVAHPIGLPLAIRMKEEFGVPYVMFERYSDPERIYRSYCSLFEELGKDIPSVLEERKQEMLDQISSAKTELDGKTYISGNTALCNYELHAFLASRLNVKPVLLQISDLDDTGIEFRAQLLSCCDPLLSRAANMTAMQYVYPELKPDFTIGAGSLTILRKNHIAPVSMMRSYNTLGFEVCEMVLESFLNANEQSKIMKRGEAV